MVSSATMTTLTGDVCSAEFRRADASTSIQRADAGCMTRSSCSDADAQIAGFVPLVSRAHAVEQHSLTDGEDDADDDEDERESAFF